MIPPEFTNFFLASAGAGAALVGLLFVAVSISPEHTVMEGAPVDRQAMAASSYTALINAFFISLGALLPINIGYFALVMGIIGIANSLPLGWLLLKGLNSWLSLIPRMTLVVVALFVYGYEIYNGWLLIQAPKDKDPIDTIAILVISVYGIGLARAWQLLGARKNTFLGWLSPLHDLKEKVEGHQSLTQDEKASSHPH